MSEWQPIESAPRDGSHVLMAGEFGGRKGDWRIKIGGWNKRLSCWELIGGSWGPTKWMPLPNPPTT